MDIKPYLAPLATCLAILISSTLWWISRRKALSYQVVIGETLVNLVGPAKRKLEVLFDNRPVHDAHLVMVKIINNGHTPINPGDYQLPITLSVGPQARIVMADLVETWPAELDERFRQTGGGQTLIEKIEGTKLTLRPVLLNPREFVTIQVLVSGASAKTVVGGHIQGINQIKEWRERNRLPLICSQVGALTMAGAMLMAEPSQIPRFGPEIIIPAILLFLLGYLCLCVGDYLQERPGVRNVGGR